MVNGLRNKQADIDMSVIFPISNYCVRGREPRNRGDLTPLSGPLHRLSQHDPQTEVGNQAATAAAMQAIPLANDRLAKESNQWVAKRDWAQAYGALINAGACNRCAYYAKTCFTQGKPTRSE